MTQLTPEQQAEIDEIKWQFEDKLNEEIHYRRCEFKDEVQELREDRDEDIKALRMHSKEDLKEAIKDKKDTWRCVR